MSEENQSNDQVFENITKQAKKKEMVEFLTSTNKITEKLAGALYDEGLNSWKKLIEGTEEYFLGFKGVGPAKATVLYELGQEKKMGFQTTRPGLKEVLEGVPRINQRIISSLLEAGYDSFESFKEKSEEDLIEIKGIGPKMSQSIIKVIKEHTDEHFLDETEEATGEIVEEEHGEVPKDERSLIQRIVDAIGGFFGGKKEETPEKEEEVPEEKTEEAPVEEQVAEETPEEGSPAEEEVPVEEEVIEEPVEEKKIEETSDEEPSEAEKEEVPQEERPEEEKKAEEPAKERGFFERFKQFFGGKKEDPKVEEPTEPGPAEEVVEDEVEKEETTGEIEEAPEGSAEGTIEEELPAQDATIKEFEDIKGISKKTADLLRNAGYLSVDELKEAVPEDLTMIEGIGTKTAEKICKALCK